MPPLPGALDRLSGWRRWAWGSGIAMSGTAETFQRLVARLDYPMFVVTASMGEHRSGCLVGFASQASIHPARFWVGISASNHTHAIALQARALAVHLVTEQERDLAELFGSFTGDQVDKFAACRWRLEEGAPVLVDFANWFVGASVERVSAGDHTWFLLEPVTAAAADAARGHAQLGFQALKHVSPGHAP